MDNMPSSQVLSSIFNEDVSSIAIKSPENLLFFSNAELLEDYDCQPSYVKIAILSELLVRLSFKRSDVELRNSLCRILSEEPVSNFERWLDNHNPSCAPKPINLVSADSPQSANQEFLQLLQQAVFSRLENLYGKCDGIIPVVLNNVGAAIPFALESPQADSDSRRCVVDLDNIPFPEWSKAISEITNTLNLKKYCVRLLFHSSSVKIAAFSGLSLQFPFLLAYWRKESFLPTYSPFSIIATGEISNNRLRPVKTQPKIKSLKERFDLLTFFCPFGDDVVSLSEPQLTIIDANTSIEDVLSTCQNKIENLVKDRSARYIILDSDYIYKRINAITIYTKKDLESRWEHLIDSLLFIEKKLVYLPGMDPETHLDCLIALSFAYCHSGKTAEALQYNSKGRKFAAERNLTNKLNDLLIHQLVLFQDIDDLSSVTKLTKEIYLQICQADIDKPTRDDMLMRYHGTMAQVHMYGTLAQIEGFSKEEAFENVNHAIHFAQETGKIIEIIRDLNYRHLWYAFFAPGSEDERNEFLFAHDYLQGNSNLFEDKDYNGNLQYQFRQRCLAAYFQILRDNQCSDADIVKDYYPSINNPIYWLKAISLKYLGAVNAFYHNTEKAKKLFDEAVSLLENDTSPLFKYICMTIAAEAYRSFSKLEDEQTAECYRQKALDLFSSNGDFITFQSSPNWLKFLNTPWKEFEASKEDFPGLHYYY